VCVFVKCFSRHNPSFKLPQCYHMDGFNTETSSAQVIYIDS